MVWGEATDSISGGWRLVIKGVKNGSHTFFIITQKIKKAYIFAIAVLRRSLAELSPKLLDK
jgi:hypothetical protein